MAQYVTSIGPVRFNPVKRTFEALVTFVEGGDVVRIPCALKFPIDMDPVKVIPALIRQAKEKRRMTRVPLMSRLAA